MSVLRGAEYSRGGGKARQKAWGEEWEQGCLSGLSPWAQLSQSGCG